MKIAGTLIAVALLSGCAVVRYADGQRVAIEYEHQQPSELQPKADQACIESGGKPPATLVSDMSVNPSLPAAITRRLATFRCQ